MKKINPTLKIVLILIFLMPLALEANPILIQNEAKSHLLGGIECVDEPIGYTSGLITQNSDSQYSDLKIYITSSYDNVNSESTCKITIKGSIQTDDGNTIEVDLEVEITLEGDQDCVDATIRILKGLRVK